MTAHRKSARAVARHVATALALLAPAVLAAPAAHAAVWQTCNGSPIKWNNGWTNMAISTTSMPPGSTWDQRYQNAMWHWNNVKGSSFNFYVTRDTDGSHAQSNGVNEVYFADLGAGSTLAVTYVQYHCYWLFGYQYGLDETDMAFNTSQSWTTGTINPQNLGPPYSFESTALHELGHALGQQHEDRWLATMNSYYPNSGPLGYGVEWDPLPDSRVGARILYPDSTTETDIAGSVFKRTGTGTSGLVATTTAAPRGSNVTVEFTFHNQGTAFQTFNIGFYLSTNNYISTSDTLLGTNTGASAGAGGSGTFTRTVTIPYGIAPGQYWLGFLVDNNNALAEANESNNTMQMPYPITIY